MLVERRSHSFLSSLISLAVFVPTPAAFGFQSISSTVSTATGQIQGQVVLDSSGSPLAGATITAYRITPAPTVSATAISAANGDFAIPGLPAGQFGICVKSSNPSLIDPCRWAELRTTVSVTNGKVSSAAAIRVKPSTPLTMRVNDTGQFLSQKSTDPAPPHVMAGVFDMQGMFHPAIQTAKDATGISYQLSIPFDFPVRMVIYSAQVKLTNAQNVPAPAQGVSQMVVQPSTQPPLPTFAFSATGRN